MADSSDFYPDEDFNFEIPDVILEQQIEAPGSSEILHEPVVTKKLPVVQRTLFSFTISSGNKEKGKF
ncbi:unnamed protein product [Rhizophagus irregularis]|nr:unnamed protein product [Rhizophagus irregularis]